MLPINQSSPSSSAGVLVGSRKGGTAFAGPIAVKACVLTAVERLHSAGYGRMYESLPTSLSEVRVPPSSSGRGI